MRISELPKPFQEAANLALSILAKDSAGEDSPHSHRWSELRYKVRHRAAFLILMLMLRTCRRTNSTLSSTQQSKRPTPWKQIWTGVSPTSRRSSTHELNARQGHRHKHHRRFRHFSPNGPPIRQRHATCFAGWHESTRHVHLRRSGWKLVAQRARCCARRMRRRASVVSHLSLLRHRAPHGGRGHQDEDDDPTTPCRGRALVSLSIMYDVAGSMFLISIFLLLCFVLPLSTFLLLCDILDLVCV